MRTIVLLWTLLLTILHAHSQGDVVFDNFGAITPITKAGASVTTGDGIVVQLYASGSGQSPTFVPVPNSIVQVGLIADGYFDGGVVRIPASIIGPGAGAFLEVRAWESAYGATFEEACAAAMHGGRPALSGRSAIFMVASTGNPLSSPPGIPVPLSDLVPHLTVPGFVDPCPEPSIAGLGAIGLGAFLLLRRARLGK